MRTTELARLARYAISGGVSAAVHLSVGYTLAFHMWPVAASTFGFVASVVVSYVLQHTWVFRSAANHIEAGSRFLAVTTAAFALNALVLWLGTEVLHAPYPAAQSVALVLIPVLNFTANSRWTFG